MQVNLIAFYFYKQKHQFLIVCIIQSQMQVIVSLQVRLVLPLCMGAESTIFLNLKVFANENRVHIQ